MMFEMIKRERWNKTTEWELTLRAIGGLLGAGGEGVGQMIAKLKSMLDDRLSHNYYDAGNIVAELQRKFLEVSKDRHIMKRLDSMSV